MNIRGDWGGSDFVQSDRSVDRRDDASCCGGVATLPKADLPALGVVAKGCLLLLILSGVGCGTSETEPAPAPLTAPQVRLEILADGFVAAVKMAFLPGGRFLFTEKHSGQVRLLDATFTLQDLPVVDVAVNHAGERGLLGIATHPDFERNGYVYIMYVANASGQDSTERDGECDIRVARFRLHDEAAEAPPEILISLPARPGPLHNEGCILFGPDGKLYVSLGELNKNANLMSQLSGNPRGKILRYNDDGSIPSDNPLGLDNPIYIYGIRNSFGFAFDPVDGGLSVSDNGPKGHDSLTKALPGENLGWPLIWGTVDEWYERWAAWWLGKRFRPPLRESFEQNSVPTAVQVLVDDRYGQGMAGRVLVGEYGSERVRQFTLDKRTRHTAVGIGTFLEGLTGIVDLQFGADGRLYILTMAGLYRVEALSTSLKNESQVAEERQRLM